jgi:hypothetical protein
LGSWKKKKKRRRKRRRRRSQDYSNVAWLLSKVSRIREHLLGHEASKQD